MKYVYTAVIAPNENGSKFYCRVPDLPGCVTTGNTIENSIEMIMDAASAWLVVAEDEENEIPKATPQNKMDIPEGAMCSVLCIDSVIYRAKTDTRAVRKNVSLPAWMAKLAEKKGVNCSQVLQDGLMKIFRAGNANL